MPPSGARFVVTKPSTSSTAHFWKWYLSLDHKSFAPFSVRGTPFTSKSTPCLKWQRSSNLMAATRLIAWIAMSMPIHLRLRLCAASNVVAQPQNGSNTVSPSSLDAFIIRSSRARGFCVLNPKRSLERDGKLISQRLSIRLPFGSM